jgi:hypothetical protein
MLDQIILDEPAKARYPVLKNRRFGEECSLALVKFESRDVLKTNEATGELLPVLKPNGKAKQELVLTGVVVSSTMIAGIGDEEGVPAPGDIVRKILRGRSFGEWIEYSRALRPRQVGDIVTFSSTTAVVYDANGKPTQEITDQATLDAVPRGRSVGVYGPLTIRRATDADAAWVQKAIEAHHAATVQEAPVLDDSGPFDDERF